MRASKTWHAHPQEVVVLWVERVELEVGQAQVGVGQEADVFRAGLFESVPSRGRSFRENERLVRLQIYRVRDRCT